MEKIASFTVDHKILKEGLYISRIDGTGNDIVTYDLRMVRPNIPPFLDNAAVHTIEHLFATFVRNSPIKDSIIYFGPMGCLTGFYFIVQGMESQTVLNLVCSALKFIADYEGEIPGSREEECGNYKMHDLFTAKKYAAKMLNILADWNITKMKYNIHFI